MGLIGVRLPTVHGFCYESNPCFKSGRSDISIKVLVMVQVFRMGIQKRYPIQSKKVLVLVLGVVCQAGFICYIL